MPWGRNAAGFIDTQWQNLNHLALTNDSVASILDVKGNCSPLALAGSLGSEHRAAGKAGADGGESA
jgi:hypothetical protein